MHGRAGDSNLLQRLRTHASVFVRMRILSEKNANTSVFFSADLDLLFDICCSGVTNSRFISFLRPAINFSITFVFFFFFVFFLWRTDWRSGRLAGGEIFCSFLIYFVLMDSRQAQRMCCESSISHLPTRDFARVWLPSRTYIFSSSYFSISFFIKY